MYQTKINHVIRAFILLAIASVAPLSVAMATTEPQLPIGCESISVPEGNKLAFHVYAKGSQIYKWNQTTAKWDFIAPIATLFAEKNFFGEVGIHYAGPKWESKSGSKVEARRVADTGCTPDPTSIAWLLLSKWDTTGAGIFSTVTYIQRVNTSGGVAPTEPGTVANETREIPYTAEYYFYKAEKNQIP